MTSTPGKEPIKHYNNAIYSIIFILINVLGSGCQHIATRSKMNVAYINPIPAVDGALNLDLVSFSNFLLTMLYCLCHTKLIIKLKLTL